MEASVDVNLEMRGLRRNMKWQSGKGGSAGCSGAVIKHSLTFSHSRVFGKPFPRFTLLRILRNSKVGRYLGFRATATCITDLSPRFVTARRIFADFSANRYGSVITIVQPLLRYFLYDLISPRFSLVARELRQHYVSIPHHIGDFLLLTAVSDPGIT